MNCNATLLTPHFLWSPGTRVTVLAYWRSEKHVSVQFPGTDGREPGQIWTLPAVAVQLDEAVELDVQDPLQ